MVYQGGCAMMYAVMYFLVSQEGSLLWLKTYGGNDYDWFEAVAIDSMGRYVVAGPSWLSGNFDPDLWIIIVDSSSGDTVRGILLGQSGVFEWPHDIMVDPEGYYTVVGQRDTLVWAVKVDTAGNVVWDMTYGAGDASAVALLPDGYYVIGATVSTDTKGAEFALIKVDPVDGSEVWRGLYGTADLDILSDLAVDSYGNCIAAGATWGASYDNYILKVSCVSGDSLWAVSFGDAGSNFATGIALDGNHYAISSFSGYGLDSSRVVAARVSALDGSLEWVRRYGNGYGRAISVSPAGYYVLAADYEDTLTSTTMAWLLKIEPEYGDTLWSVFIEDTASSRVHGVITGPLGEYVVAGEMDINSVDGLIYKVYGEAPLHTREKMENTPIVLRILPGRIILENTGNTPTLLRVFSPSGKMVSSVQLNPHSSGSISLAPGLYILRSGGNSARTVVVP